MTVANLTVDGLVRDAASAYPSKLAFIDGDTRLTFGEFDRLVDALAVGLAERGVDRGSRVATLLFNQWEFSLTYFAVVRLGALIVPLNHRLVADELTYQIDDAGARALVYAGEFAAVVDEVALKTSLDLRIVVGEIPTGTHGGAPDESLCDVLAANVGSATVVHSRAAHEDPSAIWYTSGTTGRPKGALVSHSSTLWAAASMAMAARMHHDSRLLTVAPMFHRGPTDLMHIACFMLGATQTTLRSFSPEGLLSAIERDRATHAFIVPAMTFAVLGLPEKASFDLTSMTCWLSASAPFPVEYRQRLEDETTLPPDRVYNAYGITEALLIAVQSPEQTAAIGSVGRAAPMCRIRVVDADRRDVVRGAVGEITVCTPAMAMGYVGNETAWRAVTFERDGLTWYASGDMGYVDNDGNVHIVDRSKDMIITGGENVYSAEVEQILIGMPGIAEVAVISTPSERWGEAVTAIIVPAVGWSLDAADVDAFCVGKLAGYKRPRSIRFVNALPRNSFGKIRKDQLRREVQG